MEMTFDGVMYRVPGTERDIDLGTFHKNTFLNAFYRAAAHVFSNEAIAPASTARTKNPNLTDDEYEAIKSAARDKFLEAMVAGTWGEKGMRAPRQVGENRLQTIFNNFLADDVRKAVAKSKWAEGSKADTWLHPKGAEVTLAQCADAYLNHPELGADRKAALDARAKVKYDAEVQDAALRKANKERENKAAELVIEL